MTTKNGSLKRNRERRYRTRQKRGGPSTEKKRRSERCVQTGLPEGGKKKRCRNRGTLTPSDAVRDVHKPKTPQIAPLPLMPSIREKANRRTQGGEGQKNHHDLVGNWVGAKRGKTGSMRPPCSRQGEKSLFLRRQRKEKKEKKSVLMKEIRENHGEYPGGQPNHREKNEKTQTSPFGRRKGGKKLHPGKLKREGRSL